MPVTRNYTMVRHVNRNNTIAVTERLEIPLSEIKFQFSPSRGPGGQHVNRAHTRVTLLFDVARSPSLNEETRERFLQGLSDHISKSGIVRVTAQESRSQHRNRQQAIARFVALLNEALAQEKPRIPTRPSATADKKRVEEKRRRGRRKHQRGLDWSQESD